MAVDHPLKNENFFEGFNNLITKPEFKFDIFDRQDSCSLHGITKRKSVVSQLHCKRFIVNF